MIDEGALYELSEGWVWAITSEVCSSVRDGTHDTPKYVEAGVPLITSKNLKGNVIDFSTSKNISIDDHEKISRRSGVENGDVLFAMIGTIGNPVVVQTERIFSIKNVALFKKNKSTIISQYLRLWLASSVFNTILVKNEFLKGTTQKFIPLGNLRILPIPLPPLPEQRAIVSKIEQLFSDLDNGIENFKKAQKQLKIYRQAVLKRAFEGDFIFKNDLQPFCENIGNLPMDNKVRRDVPETFKECKLSDSFGMYYSIAELLRKGILIDVKDGNHGGNHPKKSDFTEHGLPFITANVVNNFKIDYSKAYKINGIPLEKMKVGFAKAGDVILTHKGSVGRVAIANREIVCTPQTTYYNVNENYLISKYLMYFFASPIFYNQLVEVKSQTTRDFVSISKQFNLYILLLPLKEQNQIVQEIESRLSICDKMEENIAESLQKAESLRQSILKKAFEGKLLNEKELEEARSAPDWEPAEKLLERIKAEKTNTKANKRGKK